MNLNLTRDEAAMLQTFLTIERITALVETPAIKKLERINKKIDKLFKKYNAKKRKK